MKIILLFSILLISFFVKAQEYNPILPPNTYQNSDNPYYWKNKKNIDKSYWQQDVHYKIKVHLDDKTDILKAQQELTYWNNSPHDLDCIYLHLYQNAFQPNSYYDKRKKGESSKIGFGYYGKQKKGLIINNLKVNNKIVKTELDNTILKVFLKEKLKSGEKISLSIDFTNHFDKTGVWKRMNAYEIDGYTHYNGVHWYPRVVVYDRKSGWATEQHMNKEYYGEFGTYDVELTLPHNYILDGTGFLINRDEVLPKELREKLDIKNFANKPFGEKASVIIPRDSTKTKTWIFHAENVHDFGFTADPTYRIGEAFWKDKKAVALVSEKHASKWQDASDFAIKVIQFYSENLGMYAYHKIIVSDARQGMEYPMMTLDSGNSPDYKYLFAHEIGHQWFFAQVGSNETYRAVLDEGFTQFLTIWALEEFEKQGEILKDSIKNWYKKRFKKKYSYRYKSAYYPVLKRAIKGNTIPVNQHSDMFDDYQDYRQVYYKGATMLYNLKYVLGDELFFKALQHYFEKWKFCHPYLEDMRTAFIEYTQVDLNWFFDHWLNTSENLDYSFKSIKKLKKDTFLIRFERKNEMQMPIDFQVTAKDGQIHNFHIPNTWFVKKTDAIILPKWYSFNHLNKTYTAKIEIPSGVRKVEIDPNFEMADINRLNNTSIKKIKLQYDSGLKNLPDWTAYEIFHKPKLWYNAIDGLKLAWNLNGNYMKEKNKFDITVWYNSQIGRSDFYDEIDDGIFPYENNSPSVQNQNRLSYEFFYQTSINNLLPKTNFLFKNSYIDGVFSVRGRLNKKIKNRLLFMELKSLGINTDYMIYPNEWDADNRFEKKHNNSLKLGFISNKKIFRKVEHETFVQIKTSVFSMDYDMSAFEFHIKDEFNFSNFEIKTRFFFQLGFGDHWDKGSMLYLSGANPEEMLDNKYTRSVGFFSDSPFTYNQVVNHFQHGGGLNLRAYAAYDLVRVGGSIYNGKTGHAFNIEIDFDKFFPVYIHQLRNFHLDSYLFYDAGQMLRDDYISDWIFDAGIGFALTIKKFWHIENAKPLIIRFDIPMYRSEELNGLDNFEFFYLLGINRSF